MNERGDPRRGDSDAAGDSRAKGNQDTSAFAQGLLTRIAQVANMGLTRIRRTYVYLHVHFEMHKPGSTYGSAFRERTGKREA